MLNLEYYINDFHSSSQLNDVGTRTEIIVIIFDN